MLIQPLFQPFSLQALDRVAELQARLDEAEKTADDAQRKLQAIESLQDNDSGRVEELEDETRTLKAHIDALERERNEAERKLFLQDNDSGKVEELEDAVRELNQKIDSLERERNEAVRKLYLVESDLEKAEERADIAEEKAKALEDQLTAVRFPVTHVNVLLTLISHCRLPTSFAALRFPRRRLKCQTRRAQSRSVTCAISSHMRSVR